MRSVVLATILIFFLYNVHCQVTELTRENIFETVGSGDGWFVLFYTPKCGHCKRIMPTWEGLGLARNKIARVDCSTSTKLCVGFGIKSFPTFKYLINGRQYNFPASAKREKDEFDDFIEGGYITAETNPIPTIQDIPEVDDFWEAIRQIKVWSLENFWISFGVVALVFTLLGFSIGTCGLILLDPWISPPPRKPGQPVKVDNAKPNDDKKKNE